MLIPRIIFPQLLGELFLNIIVGCLAFKLDVWISGFWLIKLMFTVKVTCRWLFHQNLDPGQLPPSLFFLFFLIKANFDGQSVCRGNVHFVRVHWLSNPCSQTINCVVTYTVILTVIMVLKDVFILDWFFVNGYWPFILTNSSNFVNDLPLFILLNWHMSLKCAFLILTIIFNRAFDFYML